MTQEAGRGHFKPQGFPRSAEPNEIEMTPSLVNGAAQ